MITDGNFKGWLGGLLGTVRVTLGVAVGWLLMAGGVEAATRVKQNNQTNLNQAGSWDVVPGAADIGQWDGTVVGANSVVLGGEMSWLGLKVVGPGGLVTIGAGNTLTLGASGIDLGSATQNLILNCGLTLQGKQSWQVAAGRTLNLSGAMVRGGSVVDLSGFNASATLGTLGNEASGMLGAWAFSGSGVSLNYVKSTGGLISAYTTQTAGTVGTLANLLSATGNYAVGAGATMAGNTTANTLRSGGGATTVANGGFSLTLNGLMNAGTGDLSITGSGSFIVGANRELVVIGNTYGTTISCPVVNHGSGASSLTYAGGSSGSGLTLTGTNTYSGGTSVVSGTLFLGSQNGLGTGVVSLAAGTTFQQINFEGNSSGGALPNGFALMGSGNVIFNLPFGGGKDVWISQVVSGTGGVTVQGGTRALTLMAGNTFSGGVRLTNNSNRVVMGNVGGLGTGTFRAETTSAGSGTLETVANLSGGTGVTNAFEIGSGAYLNVAVSGTNHLLLSGSISNPVGAGGLNKAGTATLTLAGANTYSGATKVTAGILSCSTAFSLGTGALNITTGAKVNLNFSGTRRIASLTFNGVVGQANGTYGSTSSTAANKNDTYFSGTGTVTVGPAGVTSSTGLVLSSGATPAAVGASLTFTSTVAGSNPSGSVSFYDGVTLLGTVVLNSSFQASWTTNGLALGSHSVTAWYLGNGTNEPSVSSPVVVQVANPADVVSFVFPGLGAATISGTNITLIVPFSTDVTALAPTYTMSSGAVGSPVSGATRNFSTPQTYLITGADNSTKTYTVTVTKAASSTAKDITSFSFPGLGVPTIGTTTVNLTVPFGTVVGSLAPTYTVSGQAVGSPVSGTVRNFSTPQTYTITAENGSTKVYTVTVTVAAASSAKDILACDFGGLGLGTISGTSITLTVVPTQSVVALAPTFTLSPLASISPVSGSTRNFSSPVTYTVTAEDGTTKVYTVSVQTYSSWAYSGSLFILTTPEGANLAAGVTETNFPVLIRLKSGNFNFSQAQADGRDIRFTNAGGDVLPYQIEEWDAVAGVASIWVKIPTITGNARQEIRMYWGKAEVAAESNGPAVFNASNGYASVIHMNDTVTDVLGTVSPVDNGTTLATGMIGKGRNFSAGVGIHCGDTITGFAQGNAAHSTQAWFRASSVNCEIVDWGVEGGGFNKVQMRLISPPKIYIDGNFASVTGTSVLNTAAWHHVVHTYTPGTPNVSRIYIDGQLDASASVTMNLPNPSRMWIGGWYGSYGYAGLIDEVRISKVARSANWIALEYENQKPLQTLVGTLVTAGSGFAVSPGSLTINEGSSATLSAVAGGAQKVYWIRLKNGVETVLAVDQLSLSVEAGRVTGNETYQILFKAIYPSGVQTASIPVTIVENLPDPIFTLSGPTNWDGRQTITVNATVSNLSELQARGVANMSYRWTVNGVAVSKQISPGVLTLLRAQGNGVMTVTLALENGGGVVVVSKTIVVEQPATDAWVQRTPDPDEKPVNNQFFARDDTGFGRIYYRGTQTGSAASVFLKVYTTDTGVDVLYATHRQSLVGGAYGFTAPIAAGKVTYKVVYGTTTGGVDTPVGAAVTNLICGDVYLLEGQSNTVADDPGAESPAFSNNWIRTYAASGGWGNASQAANAWKVGYWGVDLALKLLTDLNIPICVINGAVGGTRIDQHQANPAGHGLAGTRYSIYANLFNRVVAAKLTHGIRAVLWHQGEQDQGSGGPDGDYDYKFYQQYFVDMSAAWKEDYPNILSYYIFQIWPAACGDVSRNDQLREVQRTLPNLYSKMRVMSTVGIVPGSSCHYVPAGYQKFCDLIAPLVEQDHYGITPTRAVMAPNIQRAYYTTAARNEIALEFGQNMLWSNLSKGLFALDGISGKVASGTVAGKVIKLQLVGASTAQAISYLTGVGWDGVQAKLVYGATGVDTANGVAALTFADLPIGPPPAPLSGAKEILSLVFANLPATTISGTSISVTVPYGTNRNGLAPVLTLSPLASVFPASGTARDFSTAQTYVVTAENFSTQNYTVTVSVAPSAYESWAGVHGLVAGVNDGQLADPDFDGIGNLLEFSLGGVPTVGARSILPTLSRVGGDWVFAYDRLVASRTMLGQSVFYGSDLVGWTEIPIPLSGGGVVTIAAGAETERVTVTVPATEAKAFFKLRVTVIPVP